MISRTILVFSTLFGNSDFDDISGIDDLTGLIKYGLISGGGSIFWVSDDDD